jgi:hypothetical protein
MTAKIAKTGALSIIRWEAGRTLRMFAQLLKRNKAEGTERWEKDFIVVKEN